ncbi:MAG: zf-HC2 domain-containing protein [Thermoleophilia bacterium]|nr:zf-HC2 domain-containing protein [Thermoleophilia bacterium]
MTPIASIRFMREHRWTARHLSPYIDRELSEPERRRVEEHAHLCPACHRLLHSLRRTVAGLGALRDRAADGPDVTAGVLGRFRAEG